MLNEPTIEKLKALGLDAMAAAWLEQQQRPDVAALSFDERFGLLVDAEYTHRENKRLGRRLKEAKLRLGQACVEDIDFPAKRELDRAVVRQLATCRWIDEHLNVLVTGLAGTGKTYVACALAQYAEFLIMRSRTRHRLPRSGVDGRTTPHNHQGRSEAISLSGGRNRPGRSVGGVRASRTSRLSVGSACR